LKKSAREHPSAKKQREGASAASRYERLVARAPKDGEPFYNVAKDLLNAGRYDLSAKDWLWNYFDQENIGTVTGQPVVSNETIWVGTTKRGLVAIGVPRK
jgi:hypothetical protein